NQSLQRTRRPMTALHTPRPQRPPLPSSVVRHQRGSVFRCPFTRRQKPGNTPTSDNASVLSVHSLSCENDPCPCIPARCSLATTTKSRFSRPTKWHGAQWSFGLSNFEPKGFRKPKLLD